MGSILKNPNFTKSRASTYRQKQYFNSKKTDRKVVKHEQSLQIELCKWIRETLPGVHFRSDTGSGAFNSEHEKNLHNLQQSAPGLPDLSIFAARHGWHSLNLELKPEGTRLKLKRDSKITKVYKNRKGKIIARDLRPRKAGEWKDYFIERQATRHEELKAERHCATFAIGLEQAKKYICWYFDIPYIENSQLEF